MTDSNASRPVRPPDAPDAPPHLELIESLSMGLLRISVDQEMRVIWSNQAAARIFGYDSPEELLKVRPIDICEDPSDRDRLMAQIEAEGHLKDQEIRCRRPDGSTVWILVACSTTQDEQNHITFIDALIQDITERKTAEDRARHERHLLRTVVDAIPAAVYLQDTEGRYLLVNKWFVEKRGGLCEADYLGKTDFELFNKERAAEWREQDLGVLAGHPILGQVRYAVGRLGLAAWLNINKVPFTDRDGRIAGLVGVILNVSEQKTAEELLRKERQLLRTIIDTLPSSLYFKDLDGRFLLANKTFLEGSGYTSEADMIGKTDFDLYTPEKAKYCRIKDAELLASGEPVLNKEIMQVAPDGTTVWRLFSSVPISDGDSGFLGLIGLVDDITDTKRAEEAIRKSEERFRMLSEQSLLAIVILGEGKVTYANQAFCDLLGYTQDEIHNLDAFDYERLVHPDDREFVPEQSHRKQSDDSDVTPHYECRILTKTGETRWVELYSKTIRHTGKSEAFVTFVDITGRKRAERGMRINEARFREVLATSRDVTYRLNLTTLSYDYIGEACSAAFGYSPDELTAMGFEKAAEHFHPDDRRRLEEHFSQLPAGSAGESLVPTIEYRWKCRDGRYRWFSDSRSAVIGPDGVAEAIVGAVRDVTESKESEEALRNSEAKYRELVEGVPVGVCQIDPAGAGTILMANSAAALMFGYESVTEFLAQPWERFYASRRARRALREKLDRQGYVRGEEIRGVRKDGCALWVLATATVRRDSQGNISHVDALLEDITERKQAASALHEAHSKLVAAREVERRRLATELHDSLGQSLVVLHLAIQNAYAGATESRNDQQASTLHTAANRCADLIREVRGVCQGLFPRVLESLGLEAALSSLARDCQGRMNASLHYPESLEGRRFLDNVEIVLYRIAQEAVHNALRHSEAEHLDLELSYADERVSLSITDDGRGFDVDRIGSNGLGLTTMRERAEAIGGGLVIESEPGHTCVRIEAVAETMRPTDSM